MKLLIKFPTRERPDRFFAALDMYYSKLAQPEKVEFIISCDTDDLTMNNDKVRARLKKYKNLSMYYDTSKNKIHAINRDIEKAGDWDILFLAQDDMEVRVDGYDDVIRGDMAKHYPGLDGALWYDVPPYYKWREHCCVLSILGRKLYEHFGYIYYPGYRSLVCDFEFTAITKRMGKIQYVDRVVITQEHHVDTLWNKNFKHHRYDVALYRARMKNNFLSPSFINESELLNKPKVSHKLPPITRRRRYIKERWPR